VASPGPMAGEIPEAVAVIAKADAENFPVAARVLPARLRRHLLAIYGFARLADDIGDEAPGDRLASLDWLEAELVTVKPVVVVALGTVAGSSLVGPAGILVATIRPSAVLRSADADARERAYAGLVSDLKAAAAAARR